MAWGALVAAGAGALGGAMEQSSKNKRYDEIMRGIGDNRYGYDRAYGGQQDALIRALARGGADQSLAQSKVANTDLSRQLRSAEASPGGVRSAMFTGGEADLAGKVGSAVGQESVGNLSAASQNIAQSASDSLARKDLALRALRMYQEAESQRRSPFSGAMSGAANGLLGYLKGGG